ncbi:MAG: twin-arginine translocase TatA/TatE family subunit [Planctomycetaceae bacterium]
MSGFIHPSELMALAYLVPSFFGLLIVGIVVLLLFGKRIPEVMRSLGSSITEFKKGAKGIEEEDDQPTSSTK